MMFDSKSDDGILLLEDMHPAQQIHKWMAVLMRFQILKRQQPYIKVIGTMKNFVYSCLLWCQEEKIRC